MEHLRVAARHLKAAEAHELAENAVQMADRMAARKRHEPQSDRKPRSPGQNAGQQPPPSCEDLRALVAEVRRLRADVEESRNRIDKKDR